MSFVEGFLAPAVEPDSDYTPGPEVECLARVVGEHLYLEVFRRPSGTFGIRHVAWVAWRDASDTVRSHSWYVREPSESGVFDLESARAAAQAFASAYGLAIQRWLPAA